MIKILFVCHGNICRSPMAELLFNDLAERAGLGGEFRAESAATSDEETGNGVYPPVRHLLAKRGVDCRGKTARRIEPGDAGRFELLIGMDGANIRSMRRLFGEENADRLHLLLEYAGRPGESISDPWYTRDFELALEEIEAGCRGLLEALSGARLIDLDGCGDREALYAALRRALRWEEGFGENLDALYDALTGYPQPDGPWILALPRGESPARPYAERIRAVFAEAGALR
ncbi:MAG: barstar family protein [Oscillospiraceae bacterium]|nr:barstar family protein [Oscillospiraceae bacterium]